MNKKLKQKIEEARQTIEWLDKDDDLALYIAELLVKIDAYKTLLLCGKGVHVCPCCHL